jgi:membrane fusion protein (multidrug efflux system)
MKVFYTLFFLSVFIFSGCEKKETQTQMPPEVKVYKIVPKDVPVVQEWVGQTLGAEDIELRARVEGFVESIDFIEGTLVQKGKLLYTIDAKELQQKVIDAEGQLTAAQVTLVQCDNDVKRYRPLAEAGAVSQQMLETAVSSYEAQKGMVESALANVRLAKINLGYSRMTAPITGIIGISQFKIGDYVSKMAGSVLNTVSDVDPIHVRFSVSEQEYLTFMRTAMKEKDQSKKSLRTPLDMILADGSLYDHKGEVNIANRQVDASTGTMMLEASFPNPEMIIRPGQFSKIRAVVAMLNNAVVIPTRAIMELQGQFQVYVVGEDKKTQIRTVKKGPQYGQFTVIESGVKADEKIIVEGILKVKPNIPVTPQDMDIPFDVVKTEGQ